jgi:hypothetical protein
VSGGQFFSEHLRHVALNDRPVDFAALDFVAEEWFVLRPVIVVRRLDRWERRAIAGLD